MAPGKYLYCIIRCRQERAFEGATAVGDPQAAVHTICHQGLAAVVSDSPTQDYDLTRANLVAHQRVLEGLMSEFTLLPVRFGTVAAPASAARDVATLLSRHYREFDGLLSEMEGKVELGVKALWRDEQTVFEEIVAQDESIRRLRGRVEGKPPQTTYLERIHLGEMVKEALERKRAAEAALILPPLEKLACRVALNATLLDRMILNAAFLVSRGREEEFDRAVRQMDEGMRSRVALRYVGPVPPYNFVHIVVNWEEVRSGVGAR